MFPLIVHRQCTRMRSVITKSNYQRSKISVEYFRTCECDTESSWYFWMDSGVLLTTSGRHSRCRKNTFTRCFCSWTPDSRCYRYLNQCNYLGSTNLVRYRKIYSFKIHIERILGQNCVIGLTVEPLIEFIVLCGQRYYRLLPICLTFVLVRFGLPLMDFWRKGWVIGKFGKFGEIIYWKWWNCYKLICVSAFNEYKRSGNTDW